MSIRNWLAFSAAAYAVIGLALLLVPVSFLALHGVALDAGGAMLARILGAATASLAIVLWLYRAVPGRAGPLMLGNAVYNAAEFLIVLYATLGGTMNAVGWGPVVLHAVLALGFAWGTLAAPRAATG